MPLFGFSKSDVEKMEAKRNVDGLIKALSYKNDEKVRECAANALGRIGDARAVDALFKALKDLNPDVRGSSVDALESIGSDLSVSKLIFALGDFDTFVRYRSALSLGRIGGERAVEALTAALKDSEVDVRNAAVKGLGRIGGPRAVLALTLAQQDHHAKIKLAVAEALGNIGNTKIADMLILALRDRNWNVRFQAAEALQKIGGTYTIDGLIDVFRDTDSNVRLAAASVLMNIESQYKIEALVVILKNTSSPSALRRRAANSLVKNGSSQAIEALAQVLNSPYECTEARRIIVEELGRVELNEAQVLPLLHAALFGPDENYGEERVKVKAAKAICSLEPSESSLPFLLKALIENIEDVTFCICLCRAIDRFKFFSPAIKESLHALLPQLLEVWKNAPTTWDEFFVNTLFKIGAPPHAIDLILKRLYEHPADLEADLDKSYRRSASATLFALIPLSRLTQEIISLAMQSSSASSSKAVEELSKMNSPISSNILHLISKKRDIFVTVAGPWKVLRCKKK